MHSVSELGSESSSEANINDWPRNEDTVDWAAIAYVIGVYVTGALIIFGIAGNLIAFCVLLRSNRRTSMYCIMEALCVSDTVILIANLVFQILPNLHDTFPQFYAFYYVYGQLALLSWPFSFAAQMATVWLTVLISAERWVAVCRPLLTVRYCSYKRTRLTCYAVLLLSVLYCAPRFFEYTVCSRMTPDYYQVLPDNQSGYCPENGTGYSLRRNEALGTAYSVAYCAILYFLSTFLIPVVLIGVLNINLIVELQRSKATWAKLSRNQKKERKITRLPIGIVVLFLVCGAPALAVNVLDAAAIHLGNHWDLMVTVGNLLIVLNSATNFIVYCLVGKEFRLSLLNLCCLHKQPPSMSTPYSLYSYSVAVNTATDVDCAESDSAVRCDVALSASNTKCSKVNLKPTD